jgi:hypothetical protein
MAEWSGEDVDFRTAVEAYATLSGTYKWKGYFHERPKFEMPVSGFVFSDRDRLLALELHELLPHHSPQF